LSPTSSSGDLLARSLRGSNGPRFCRLLLVDISSLIIDYFHKIPSSVARSRPPWSPFFLWLCFCFWRDVRRWCLLARLSGVFANKFKYIPREVPSPIRNDSSVTDFNFKS
jgi:hypothetical protein